MKEVVSLAMLWLAGTTLSSQDRCDISRQTLDLIRQTAGISRDIAHINRDVPSVANAWLEAADADDAAAKSQEVVIQGFCNEGWR